MLTDAQLVRNLVLSLPILKNTADMILNSLLYKFQGEIEFIWTFQKGLESIVLIMDKKTKQKIRESQGNYIHTESSDEEADDGRNEFKNEDYPPILEGNIENIKSAAVIYAKKLFELFVVVSRRGVYRSFVRYDEITPFTFVKLLVNSTIDTALIQQVRDWFTLIQGDPLWGFNENHLLDIDARNPKPKYSKWTQPYLLFLVFAIAVFKLRLGNSDDEDSRDETELFSPMISHSRLERNASKETIVEDQNEIEFGNSPDLDSSLVAEEDVKIGEYSTTSEQIEVFLLKGKKTTI